MSRLLDRIIDLRVAIVVQRFGDEIIGGAEAHAKMVADRLYRAFAWDITVLTTTSKDYKTWGSAHPEGLSDDGLMRIMRFRPLIKRNRLLFGMYHRIVAPLLRRLPKLPLLAQIFRPLELLWYVLQGPFCPQIPAYLEAHAAEYSVVFFFTYLYFPTAFGIAKVPSKAILIPTAHDESAFFFPRSAKVMADARYIFANTSIEKELISQTYPGTIDKLLTVGVGLDPWTKQEIVDLASQDPFGLKLAPFLLYLGRISRGKGVDRLCEEFLAYVRQTKDQGLLLVFAGQVEDFAIPEHPQIKFLGQVNDQEKFQLLAQSFCLVNSSSKESMSLVVLEALNLRRPVLANGHCPVFCSYATELRTLRIYRDESEFIQSLSTMRKGELCNESDFDFSQGWVHQHFSWNTVLRQYQHAAEAIVSSLAKNDGIIPS
jgi:glycosyltransferase involved in cell wall biosynthesis